MSTIVTRASKGSRLTWTEADANFDNLNTDKYEDGDALGTPASGVLTNCTGTAAGLTAGAVAVGGITGLGTGVGTFLVTPSSLNLKSAITDETGSGALVFADTPTLVTPVLGVATATSVNKVAITAPATAATLTIANNKTLTVSNTMTLTGTDSTVYDLNSTSSGWSIVSKTADESVNNSTTLQDDDHLTFSGLSGETYSARYTLFYSAPTADGDFKFDFNSLAGNTSVFRGSGYFTNDSSFMDALTSTTDPDTDVSITSTNTIFMVCINITFTLSGNANCTLRWAQRALKAEDTKILKGSTVEYKRIS